MLALHHGLRRGFGYWIFALLVAARLRRLRAAGRDVAVLKSEGALQQKAIAWARWGLMWVALAVALISIATPSRARPCGQSGFLFLVSSSYRRCARDAGLWHRSLENIGKKRLETVRLRGGDLCALVRRARLQPVPVHRDGPADDLGGGRASSALAFVLTGTVLVLPFIVGYTFYVYACSAARRDPACTSSNAEKQAVSPANHPALTRITAAFNSLTHGRRAFA